MNKKFSERYGFSPVENTIQLNDISHALRISLWNCFQLSYKYLKPDTYREVSEDSQFKLFFEQYWLHFEIQSIEDIPKTFKLAFHHFKYFFSFEEWYKIYDLIEFVVQTNSKLNIPSELFIERFNSCLEKHNSGYRIISEYVAPIISNQEVESINNSMQFEDRYDVVSSHFKKALGFLSDKVSPDYPNSMKESISAVESMCKLLVNDEGATLGKAIKKLKAQNKLDPTFVSIVEKIYGYTNDADGVRHGMFENSTITLNEAIFMISICSSFSNYLYCSFAETTGMANNLS